MAGRKLSSSSSMEKTRESLIALSYTMPDNNESPKSSDNNVNSKNNNTVIESNSKSGDFRSELISLSYTLPDAEKKLPQV